MPEDVAPGEDAEQLVEAVAENTLLGSPTSGTVAKVHVKVWDKVKAGDKVLRALASDLRSAVRLTDTVARMGGDEFVVLLRDLDADAERARRSDDWPTTR